MLGEFLGRLGRLSSKYSGPANKKSVVPVVYLEFSQLVDGEGLKSVIPLVLQVAGYPRRWTHLYALSGNSSIRAGSASHGGSCVSHISVFIYIGVGAYALQQ